MSLGQPYVWEDYFLSEVLALLVTFLGIRQGLVVCRQKVGSVYFVCAIACLDVVWVYGSPGLVDVRCERSLVLCSCFVPNSVELWLCYPDPFGLGILSCLFNAWSSVGLIVLLGKRGCRRVNLLIKSIDMRLGLIGIGSDVVVVVWFYVRPSIVFEL